MRSFTWEAWPLLFIGAGMIAAAVIDWWKFKVPNKLTYPLVLSGWLLGALNDLGVAPGGGQGGFGGALLGTFVGLGLMLPIYSIGGMGAGDVKMTMGFGAWVGAYYGYPEGPDVIFWSFCAGTIAGGIIAAVMIVIRGQYASNVRNFRDILTDLTSSANLSEVADKATKRRPRWHRLPYGVPLCIGFVGYLIYLHGI